MKLAKRIKTRLENINNLGINPLTIANPKKSKVIKEETFKPPSNVQKEAQKALDYRDKHGDEVKAGTQVGWTRANQLAKGEPVSLDTIKRMVSFFARHAGNETVKPELKDTPWKDNGYVAFLLWGGRAGHDWAKGVLIKNEDLDESIEAIKNKSKESGVSYDILKKVYDRGMGAYASSGSRPGVTSHQWAMARINSFLTGGKTQKTTDADLWAKAKGQIKEDVPDKYLSGLSDKEKKKREKEIQWRANLPDSDPRKFEPLPTDKKNPSDRESKHTKAYQDKFGESRLSKILSLVEQVYTPPKHLGFTRNNMPQIEDDKQEDFLKHLEDQGIKYKKTKMKVSDITPSQKEIRADIATKLFKDNSPKLKKPLVVSSDNYLMDGHHRWLALYQDNQNTQVDVYKVDTTGKKLIDLMKKFDPIRKGIE